jgi:hypothetical protein
MIATSPTCRSATDLQCPVCHNYWDSIAHPGMKYDVGIACFDPIIICPNCAEMYSYERCDNCGVWDNCAEIGNKFCCTRCANMHGWSRCKECKTWFEEAELVDCDGNKVCVKCACDFGYSYCEACGKWIENIVDCNGTYYCEDCANNHGWNLCTSCEVWSNDTVNDEGGDSYCCNCYSDRYSHCEQCDCETYNDDVRYDEESGYVLCDFCYGNRDGNEYWEQGDFINTTGYFGSTRKFGIELETHRCPDYVGFKVNRAWGAKHDNSISGKEFVSSILSGNSGLTAIDDLCAYADDNGWTVNNDCGFHLHLDVSKETNESRISIVAAALATYSIWKKFVKVSRHSNTFCTQTEYTINDLKSGNLPTYHSRYSWFNVNAYNIHHTFEVRLHEGTLDATTVKNWTKAWTIFADWASKKTITEIKREFANLSVTGIFYKMCKIWKEGGCPDLIAYYSEKGGFNSPVSFEDKLAEIRELSMARGIGVYTRLHGTQIY